MGIEIFLKVIFLKRCDYYFFTSPPFISCFFGALAAILKGGRVIFDVRDIYPDIYVKQGLITKDGFLHKIISALEIFIYDRSYAILTATNGLNEIVKSRTKTNCVLFRNGYSKYFKVSNKKNKNFSLVFHGNMGKFQNIELLVELIRDLNVAAPELQFYAIGSGPKEILLNQLNSPNFKFYGRLTNKETAELVNTCHLGLSLRDDSQISIDAFPVKLYEYIGAGLPSISTPVCEGGEVLSNLGIGYNLGNNKSEIIDLILSLYKNEILYESLVERVISSRELFSRGKTIAEVFNRIL